MVRVCDQLNIQGKQKATGWWLFNVLLCSGWFFFRIELFGFSGPLVCGFSLGSEILVFLDSWILLPFNEIKDATLRGQ